MQFRFRMGEGFRDKKKSTMTSHFMAWKSCGLYCKSIVILMCMKATSDK